MVKKLELEAFIFVIIGALVGVFILGYYKNRSVQFYSNAASNVQMPIQNPLQNPSQNTSQTAAPATTTPIHTPMPTVEAIPTKKTAPAPIISIIPTVATTSQISSDGTQKVIMQTSENEGQTTYEFSTATNPQPFFAKTLANGDTMSIPFNAWSPDNNYFFIQENSASGTSIYVFQASGQPFANGQSYLNLTDAFSKYGASDSFDQASGWASNTLIVILTKASDGSEGTSYWYEVPDGSIIPLSTKF